ncbi:hypothetical protein [Vibrio parahaemolyticus]|uniref:hypothetical protein n=3 Tax=Vibrio parahaemolyticus TaxID=670 RepID=UPI0007B6D85F|nr:hypothetical protein [Vibrio parahaemolyticus]ANB96753.1 hypothetical protein FORC14_1888 [Vibrio parahaemolyticus]EGQ8609172.1 hypothetical protein [Vibrio parahaemolyticus]HAS6359529.1 hypothetical protein [Vibrio vulnificus]HDY7608064.1 hypothetical protein [Vibrio vulnificus]
MFKLEPFCGCENIKSSGKTIGKLKDFWGWSYSALYTPITRGFFAEYIVFKAIDDDKDDGFRPPLNYLSTKMEKDEPDLITYFGDDKMTIQVKSIDNLKKELAFTFDKTHGYNASTDLNDLEKGHHSYLFVFCFLELDKEKHDEIDRLRKTWNETNFENQTDKEVEKYRLFQDYLNESVLDMSNWTFYLCRSNVVANQKSIRVSKLNKLAEKNTVVKCSYSQLHASLKVFHVLKVSE